MRVVARAAGVTAAAVIAGFLLAGTASAATGSTGAPAPQDEASCPAHDQAVCDWVADSPLNGSSLIGEFAGMLNPQPWTPPIF